MILDNFKQWLVANTPYLETTKLLNQKGGFKEIWDLGLYWKSRPVFQYFLYGIEIRIKSVNQDDSPLLDQNFLWNGPNVWSILLKTKQKNPVDPQEEESLQTSSSVVAARSKAKAKRQPRESTGTTTHPIKWKSMDWYWAIKAISRFVRNSRRKSSIFFDTIRRYIEKKMEQFSSTK